jgi:uncharacterized Zn finger protein (UPF0148 family)
MPAFEGDFTALKERQLLFQLTRQLVQAQFVRADRVESERLWQEAAAEEMDPERITALLYGVADHDDNAAMEAIDRVYREERRLQARRWRWPALNRGRHAAAHRSAPPAALPARRGDR